MSGRRDREGGKEQGRGGEEMQSPCTGEASQVCLRACCAAPFRSLVGSAGTSAAAAAATTTSRAYRAKFAAATAAVLFPGTCFASHDSIPSLPDAYSGFLAAYPQYQETEQADRIRDQEYRHLSDHISLDYSGFGLFSHAQLHSPVAPPPPPTTGLLHLNAPFFGISSKSASLKCQVQQASQGCAMETAIGNRIMRFLNTSGDEYGMAYTASKTSAFRLLAESYPFRTNNRLVTVYDYESEEVSAMAESSQKRGAKVMPANFSWPSLRIDSAKMNRMIIGRRNKKGRGLFVFPLQSGVSGARYSCLWMRLAQENGWHVLLDACALGPKDLDTLGLSLIRPDFLVCSFFKVFGEDPSGFACLFVRRSTSSILESSVVARSSGMVSILPARTLSHIRSDCSCADSDAEAADSHMDEEPIRTTGRSSSFAHQQAEKLEHGDTSEQDEMEIIQEQEERRANEMVEMDERQPPSAGNEADCRGTRSMEIECRGLNHADSLGLVLISSRLRCITNWLVTAFTKLQHPNSEKGHPLVRIYGPRVKFDRGPYVAFNLFDWKGEKIEPALVQKLADRSNISLNCGFLQNICFTLQDEDQKKAVLEKRTAEVARASGKGERIKWGVSVISASLGFLANFEDAYKLWAFVARFLDADFVEKERWRYMSLNRKTVEI